MKYNRAIYDLLKLGDEFGPEVKKALRQWLDVYVKTFQVEHTSSKAVLELMIPARQRPELAKIEERNALKDLGYAVATACADKTTREDALFKIDKYEVTAIVSDDKITD